MCQDGRRGVDVTLTHSWNLGKSQLASHRYPTRQCVKMAEEYRVNISEEVNPPVPAHSQPPPTQALPPPTPAGVPPVYSGAPSMHLPPPTSSGAPLSRVSLTSSTSDDHARITALEGTVNQLAASMTTNMVKLFALLRGPNRASSSSTPPPGQGPTIDPTPWIPPTQVPEATDAPAPPTMHTSTIHLFTTPLTPPPAPTAVPLPPAAFLSSEQALSAPPPISMLAPAAAPPPINTTFLEPGTSTHAAQFASPTHFLPEVDAEQERRLKRMEETIRALQANEARPNASYGDCSLFPGMWLPSKFKIPEFKTYEGTTDPRHHLRHYRGKMLQYWEYEEFVIHSFQDSLSRLALDWFMSLKAEDIPMWADLSRKFIDQYHTSDPPIVFGELYVCTPRGPYLRSAMSASIPYPTNLLLCTTASASTYGAITRCPPLYPYSTPSPSIPTPDSEDFSANTTSPTPTSVCVLGEGESEQGCPSPFVIEYVPAEAAVGFTGIGASPAPFVIDIPVREPYSDDKVPWTYEGSVGNLEQQFNVMGVTRLGWLYENPATTDNGKAPTAEVEAIPRAPPTPPKKVTEEEAEAFMKIIKASKYKVVQQMAKSPAHISLLALLLSSEPHREALLRVLKAAQVPKGTPPDLIKETGRFSCATTTSPVPALGHAGKGSTAPLKLRSTSIGGDSAFAPPAMKSLKPAGATISTASLRTMGGSSPSIVKHFFPLDTEKFPPKQQQLRWQRASLLLLIKEERLFDRLKEYKLRLNPAKCTFGARSGKLLGFVVNKRGIEGQAIADHLAEFPIEDSTPINPDFPDEGNLQVKGEEEKPGWKMYFDGAVNSAGFSIGAVLISPDGRYNPVAAKIDFPCTNNVAKYEACILGLQAAIDFKVKELEVFDDSMLTIFQTLGQWKKKDAKLVPYHEYLERLTESFEDISFTYTPRMKNQFADALATLASMVSITRENLIEPLKIVIAKGPAHCNAIEAFEAKSWYENIKNFLRTSQYPPFADRRDRKTLRRLAIHYFLSGEILYRWSFDSTLLRCIDEHKSRRLMEEMHGEIVDPI
ncbi:hypothetical protein CRG98_003316 [Punica granatum]|uniref:RNase H type-1 domain-containing protein n=1 Tax=Punica granatum TaxID=22663 RepID=A0A2I0L6F4_PUNGR|nr:hypothetical protein CRG98_003316 [Punica granatum]